jgi:hypothetical protein
MYKNINFRIISFLLIAGFLLVITVPLHVLADNLNPQSSTSVNPQAFKEIELIGKTDFSLNYKEPEDWKLGSVEFETMNHNADNAITSLMLNKYFKDATIEETLAFNKFPTSSMNNLETPEINLDPEKITASLMPNLVTTETLTIANTGSADLIWEIVEDPAITINLGLTTDEAGIDEIPSTMFEDKISFVLADSQKIDGKTTTFPKGRLPSAEEDYYLIVDDGTIDDNIGIGGTFEFTILNRFTPNWWEFPLSLNQIQVYFGGDEDHAQVGDKIILTVYENTSGNADPVFGSTFLASYPTTVTAVNDWNLYTLEEPIELKGPGDVLIGVIFLETPGTAYSPATLDQTDNRERSWLGWWYNTLPSEQPFPIPDAWGLTDIFGIPGNWMIRGKASYEPICSNPDDVPWLEVDPLSGTIIPGSTAGIDLKLDSTGMVPGEYSAHLCITSNDPDTALSIVLVELIVEPPPCLSIDPENLDKTLLVNSTGNEILNLINTCEVEVDFTLSDGSVSWLSENPESGTIPPGCEVDITVTFDSTGLDIGDYFAIIRVRSPQAPTIDLPVFLHVVNEAPIAKDQAVETLQDTPIEITLEAIDADDDPLTFIIVDEPEYGELQYGPGDLPTLTYIPNPDWSGVDRFTFKVNDGFVDSNTAEVNITVRDNAAPIAVEQSIVTLKDTPIEITLEATDADNDPLTFYIVDEPDHGTLDYDAGDLPTLTYTPDPGWVGEDSFTFKVNDGFVDSNIATVNITVRDNAAPIAKDQAVATALDTPIVITLVATDPDGDVLAYSIVDEPEHGILEYETGELPVLTYIPNPGWSGVDRFTFKANDGLIDSNIATVTITVGAKPLNIIFLPLILR